MQSGETAMLELLKQHTRRRPTAVFAANDEMAVGAIRAARVRGVRTPHDLSIVGFDNQHFLEAYDPPLTTVDVPRFAMGYEAMKRLADHIRQPRAPMEIRLPTRLLVRATTAKPA